MIFSTHLEYQTLEWSCIISKISIKDFEEASGHAKNLISSKVYLTFASDM